MYEKLLSEAEKCLEDQKTKELPILEMWDAMMERAEQLKFEMPENIGDFECLLEADKRFTFIKTKLSEEIEDIDVGEEEGEYEVGEDFFEVEEMEKLGFNEHQIIGLKKYERKKMSDDDDDDIFVRPKAVNAKANSVKSTQKKKVNSTHRSQKQVKKKK